jgi:dihydroorotase-like cyclic amidohydrolase
MVRLALISKHIVLTDCFGDNFFAYPQPGAVLIEDSFISDVILEKDVMMLGLLRERLRDWEIVDYSEFYISPGVIDLNTRAEWEDISELTREAVNSGTTLIVVEPGYYHHQDSSKALHCDIFKVSVLQDGLFSEVDPNFPTVLKAYLFPPAPNVKSISNLQHILQTCSNSKHPFFIDATMPDPRMLYMASPLRLEEVSDRKTAEKSSFSYFASAFSQEGQESDEEEEEDQSSSFPLRSGSLPMGSQWVMPSKDSGQGTLKEISPVSPHEFPLIQNKDSTKRNSQQLNNIYDGLDIRISQSKVNQEDLFRAETSTYSYSGQTNYGGLKKTSSGSELPGLESLRSFSSEISRQSNLLSLPKTGPGQGSNSPEPSGIAGRIGIRGRNLNLAPLNTCKTPTTSSSSDYNHHLANIPVDWETSGVSKVLESISGDSKVHFCGLSSSASLNLIRKAKASKKVTCEITAVNLCFTSECIENGNTRFKNNPPVRNYSNNLLLWDLLKMKGIDLISSGHASIVPDMKLTGNFQTAYSGIAGLGCTLQSVWYILNKPVSTRQLLEHYIVRLAKWTSLHPAEVLRVSHQRGSIKKGKFADLVVWDPWEKYKLGSDFKYSATSPFVGVELLGKIKQVYFKGSPKLQL